MQPMMNGLATSSVAPRASQRLRFVKAKMALTRDDVAQWNKDWSKPQRPQNKASPTLDVVA